MAIKSGFFNSVNGDRKYNANSFAEYFTTFIGNGVFPNPSDNLQIISNNDMTVTAKAGKAWINGYIIFNDDDYILNIEPADGVFDRIDRIVARYDTVDREIRLEVKQGDCASSPKPPVLQRDADAYELALADVLVSNGSTSISQAKVTDVRLNAELCGVVHGTVEQVDTTTLFNQYLTWLDEKKNQYDADMLDWTSQKQQEYENWKTQQETEMDDWQAQEQFDFENWKTQQETEMDDWQAQEQFDFENWKVQEKANFDDWFATIQDILDGDVAANLASRISGLENDFTSHLAESVSQVHGGIVPNIRQIIAGTGLTGGGNLTINRTLSVLFGTGTNDVARGNHTHDYVSGVTGTYTGTGIDGREINVGFTPKLVLITNKVTSSYDSKIWILNLSSSFYFHSSKINMSSGVIIVPNGFKLGGTEPSEANVSSQSYDYIAFK